MTTNAPKPDYTGPAIPQSTYDIHQAVFDGFLLDDHSRFNPHVATMGGEPSPRFARFLPPGVNLRGRSHGRSIMLTLADGRFLSILQAYGLTPVDWQWFEPMDEVDRIIGLTASFESGIIARGVERLHADIAYLVTCTEMLLRLERSGPYNRQPGTGGARFFLDGLYLDIGRIHAPQLTVSVSSVYDVHLPESKRPQVAAINAALRELVIPLKMPGTSLSDPRQEGGTGGSGIDGGGGAANWR